MCQKSLKHIFQDNLTQYQGSKGHSATPDVIPEVGHPMDPLIWLLWSAYTQGESGEQSFRLAQWSR
jgi:hypothetical protein